MKNPILPLAAALAAMLLSASCSEKTCTAPGETLPILAWHSIPSDQLTEERFQELADAGFNINFSHLGSLDDALKSLELGRKTGVKILLTCSELRSKPDSVAALVKDHPALWGYFLRDEPWCSDFPDLAAWARRIEAVDSVHQLYLNLYPIGIDYPTIGARDYRDYVRRFIDEVGLPMVSFDHYPVRVDGLRQDWYENLEIIREESARSGLPFWAFAMCVPHWHYPEPTMTHLRIEAYTDLAYGASGLQYFTYWTPRADSQGFNYRGGPISYEGQKTEMYDRVKTLNAELQARAGVFVGSEVVQVGVVGDVPPGATPLKELPEGIVSLDTHGARALVSLLQKGKKSFLVVVSGSIEEPLTLDISFRKKACEVDREGRYVPVGKHPEQYRIEAGDVRIFRLR
ncbi:MAG: hypothetical protein II029_02530 [Bacteroidales bacterium]|nr:hypothetical protein [Bacteroidales bacterium]